MRAAPLSKPIPITQLDFRVPGKQVGDVVMEHLRSRSVCRDCHDDCRVATVLQDLGLRLDGLGREE